MSDLVSGKRPKNGVLRAGRSPRVFGHRGAAGAAPENTIEGFRAALAAGADVLEMDVHATRDGAVVVLHDDTVDRTTDGAGHVRSYELSDLRRLDASCRFGALAGHDAGVRGPLRIPLLEEVLEAFPGVPLNIEIKQSDPPIEALVGELLERHGAFDRVLLAAENHVIMQCIRAMIPEVTTGLSEQESLEFLGRTTDPTYTPPGVALQVPVTYEGMDIVSQEFVAHAHARGLEVHVWTINDPLEIRWLLDLGVDGIISDLPAVVRSVIG
jgi:glycerophosphoryl diester phosphodiesterase